MLSEDERILRYRKSELGVEYYKQWGKEWDEVRKMVLEHLPKDKTIPIVPRTKGEMEDGD